MNYYRNNLTVRKKSPRWTLFLTCVKDQLLVVGNQILSGAVRLTYYMPSVSKINIIFKFFIYNHITHDTLQLHIHPSCSLYS